MDLKKLRDIKELEKPSTWEPTFFDAMVYCNDKGFELIPDERSTFGIRVQVYKDGKFLKQGIKLFKTWDDAQKESYIKIYLSITKK